MKRKVLKFRDLPCNLRGIVEDAYGHIQRAQNPTVKHILKKIKLSIERAEKEGWHTTVKEKSFIRSKLFNYTVSWECKQGSVEAARFFKKNTDKNTFVCSYGATHFRPVKMEDLF